MQKNSGLVGRVALLLTAIIWGSTFFIFKNALDSLTALWLLAIRFIIATLAMLPVCWRRLLKMDRRAVVGGIYMGLCLTAAYIFQTYGLKYTSAGNNAFLTASYCVLVPFLMWAIYKKRPGIHNIAAALLCMAGIGFVSLDNGFDSVNIGDVLTLICGVFYALQIIVTEKYVHDCDALCISAVQFAVTGVICFFAALILEPIPAYISTDAWLTLLYLGVIATALCWFLQAWGMKYTPSSTATVLMSLEAVFGVIFAGIFAGEVVTLGAFFGFVLILAAELLSELGGNLFKRRCGLAR